MVNQTGPILKPVKPMFIQRNEKLDFETITSEELDTLFMEYQRKSKDFMATMSFVDFLEILGKKYLDSRAHVSNRNDDRRDLQHKVNKFHAPTFDGSNKLSAQAWLQKLQTYFTLIPMVEEDAIQFATLHFEGVAYDWWHHGLITQGHNRVQIFDDFNQRLFDRFERKDEEELARIR
eukprot:Gb_33720 [translate_table: standard]